MNDKKCIVVDMDGTLTDHRWRLKHVPQNGGSWDEFHERSKFDKPTDLVPIINFLSKFFPVVISTSRPKQYFEVTKYWIEEYCEFTPSVYYLRSDMNKDKSTKLKNLHYNEMIESGLLPILAFDDREDICEMWNENHVPAICYKIPIDLGDEFVDEEQGKIDISPDGILRNAADLFETRNSEYGSGYLQHGKIMKEIFPNGITLKTEEDFFKYHVMVMDVVKTTRIATNFSLGKEHTDSWEDKIVYSAMQLSKISNREQ